MTARADARGAALEILRRVRAGQTFDSARESALEGLDEPDRRLAYEIAAGVLRGRRLLDRRIRPLVDKWRDTSHDLRDLLRIGTYQLIELDRVPDHAAVHTTVEIAKQASGRSQAGLVNAVLRRVDREVPLADRAREAASVDELAEQFSHPTWLVERWLARHGTMQTKALLVHNNARPSTTLQPIGWSLERLGAALDEHEISWQPAPNGCGLVVGQPPPRALPGYHEGAFIVQDPAQAMIIARARIPEGALVWDACASPGGKTALMRQRGPVLAMERRRARIAKLRDTLVRVSARAPLIVGDAARPPVRAGAVDVAVVDVPCSGTGTFARHPDARWRLSAAQIEDLSRQQADILHGASSVVGPGCALVYITCSLEPEENVLQIDRFLHAHPEFVRQQEDLHIFPPDQATDGGYMALLTRVQ